MLARLLTQAGAEVDVVMTRAAQEFVGKPATDEYRRRTPLAPDGVFKQATLEGVPVYVAWSRIPISGWSFALAVPAA